MVDGCVEKAVALRHHVVDLELRLDPATLHGSALVTVRALRDTSRVALDAKRLKVARVTTPDGGYVIDNAGRNSGDWNSLATWEPW